MMKQIFDRVASLLGLLLLSPLLLPVMFLVWWQDKHSPFYVADRVGKGERTFRMVKLRSMIVNADKSGVDSTANNDRRITAVGHFIRRYKLDELMQLYNVLKGDMSLVGPRPNVRRETDLYTAQEKRLLSVLPGITDLSSIVFSDEGSILEGKDDPDIAYNQLIRPGKSLLGLFYIDNRSFLLDLRVIWLTVIAILSKARALEAVVAILHERGAPQQLIDIAARQQPLSPMPPPGARSIVTNREGRVDAEN